MELATLHRRASQLLADALEQPTDARAGFLDRACGGEPEVRAEVESLLEAHASATTGGLLDQPIVSRSHAEALVGRSVGPWRLVGVLGEGGMGAVYRAERDDGAYGQTVALKMLRPGVASRDLVERFRAERQVLARLEHRSIARLYDGGVDGDGRPYLALELVDGVPITQWAREASPSVEARVRVFAEACEAVAFAHRHLVVHRDLKPSNLLVVQGDAGPEVRLLDFGIAKLLDSDDDTLTRTGVGPLTPAYAAPEQVRGDAVTTATDVYALGLVLYEVLTGQRPHRLDGATPTEVERRLTTLPDRPSEASPEPALARRLRGDLDTIVLKALAPEPERRYASAAAFAADLRRHLGGLPVEARPATARYRALSFARRHRAGVAAGAVAALALLVGAGVAGWQAREAAQARDRAEARFAVAQEAARAMLYDVHDAIAGLEGATPAREIIVTRSLDYLDRLAATADADPSLRLDLAGAYFRIGNVQGNPTDNNLGRTADAIASYRRGLSLLPPLGALPDSLAVAALTTEGRLHEKLGVVIAHTAGPDSALARLDLAIATLARARALAPRDPDRLTYLATAHINRGDYAGHPYFPNAGRPDSSLAHYARARTLLQRIPEGDETLFSLRMLGITHEREGTLLRDRGDLDAAVPPTRRALVLRQRIAERPDATAGAARDVGVSHEALGRLFADLGRPADAVRELTRAFEIYDAQARADPESANAQETVAFGHLHLGRALARVGRRGEGLRHLGEAARLLRTLAERDPGNSRSRSLAEEAETALADAQS